MSDDDILWQRDGAIGRITFDRLDSRNAFTFAMYDRLKALCEDVPDGVRAIVMQGAGGRAFAAGTDMTEFRGFDAPEDAIRYEQNADAVFTAIERCPVPTVAAITGACTGGGGAIAACCDIRICDAALKFGFPIARTLGNCLSVASLSRLVSLIGQGRVREMLLTSRLIEAEEAERIGLVSEVLPDADAALARGEEVARQMASMAPLTLKATREGLRRLRLHGPGADDHDLVTMCYMSEDFREGMEAFLAKRRPEWKGR